MEQKTLFSSQGNAPHDITSGGQVAKRNNSHRATKQNNIDLIIYDGFIFILFSTLF